MAAEKKSDLFCNDSLHFNSTEKLFDLTRDEEIESAIQTLILEGVDIDPKDAVGYTPLLFATVHRRKNIAKLLIKYGANIDCREVLTNGTLLHYASRNGSEWLDIVQFLLKREPDLDVRDMYDQTALHHAVISRSQEIVKCLVEAGADVDAGAYLNPPLLNAARRGQRQIVNILLNAGAKADICDFYTCTVLHYAACFGWVEVIQSLVKSVPDFDVRDERGLSALHVASVFGHLPFVKCLLEQKVDINAVTKNGQTAVLLACQKRNLNIVEYLFQVNARCDIAHIGGKSPLHYLIKMKRPSVKLIKLFIEKTGDILPADYDAILNNSQLKAYILQDVEFCCQATITKYNNRDLPDLYKLPVAGSLPRIERMEIGSQTGAFQTIERAVRFEIQTGHCNLFNVRPNALKVLCVKSVLAYYDKKFRNSE